jgi:cellulose synthase operon protein C
MRRSLRLSALSALVAAVLVPAPAAADFNPRGRTRAAPAPPPRAAPARPSAPRATAPADSDAAALSRYRALALARPAEAFPLQRLVELHRKRDGDLQALIEELKAKVEGGEAPYAALVVLAGVYRHDGQVERARETYEAAMAKAPREPAAVLALARLLEDRRAFAEARAAYERALPLVHADSEKEAILRTLMTLALEMGDPDEAKRRHEEIVKRAGGSSFIRGELGRELMLRGQHERAEVEFRALVRGASGDNRALAPALRDLGRSLAAQRKYAEARETLDRALRTAGDQSGLRREILDVVVVVYRAENQLSELIELLEKERAADFDRLNLLGGLYEETGRIDDALSTYQRALKKQPRDVSTRLKVVRLLEAQGKLVDAVKEYEELIRAAPHDPTFVFQLAEALVQRGDRAGALKRLTDLERRARGDEDTLAALVDFYERTGEPERARKLLERLAAGQPRDPRHLVELGDRYFREGDEKRAMTVWARIRHVVPNEARAQQILGEVYLEHDRTEEAIAAFERAIALEPQEVAHQRAYANALERSGSNAPPTLRGARYDAALKVWENLLRNAGDDDALARDARQRIVTLWSVRRQLTEHVRPLERRLGASPPDLDAGRLLAEVYTRLRRHEDAVRALRRIESLAPGDAENLLRLERALVLGNHRAEALATLEKLVKLDPQRAREYYQRMAQYAAELYRDDDAVRYAARAVELSPDDAEGHRRLGEMYRRRQETDRAATEFRRAIAKNDRLFPVYFDLAELLTNQGDLDGADQLLRRVMRSAPDDEMVSRAVRLSIQIHIGRGTLESLERELLPVSLGNPQRPIYRRLLVEVYGHSALALQHQARSADAAQAAKARAALGEMGTRAVKPLLDALNDERESQQRIALELLAHVRNKSAGPALFNYALGPADATLRARAMIAVGALADPALLPRFEELLGGESVEDEADTVAVAGAWAVARMNHARARPLLTRMLQHGAPSIGALGAVGLGLLGNARDAAALSSRLEDPTAGSVARAAAAFALGALGDTRRTEGLVRLAQTGDALARGVALVALARIGHADAAPHVARALVSEDPVLRHVAAGAALVLATKRYETAEPPLGVPAEDRIDVRRVLSSLMPDGYDADADAAALAHLGAPLATAAALAV